MEGFLNLIAGYFGGGFSRIHKPYPYSLYRWAPMISWRCFHYQSWDPAKSENSSPIMVMTKALLGWSLKRQVFPTIIVEGLTRCQSCGEYAYTYIYIYCRYHDISDRSWKIFAPPKMLEEVSGYKIAVTTQFPGTYLDILVIDDITL